MLDVTRCYTDDTFRVTCLRTVATLVTEAEAIDGIERNRGRAMRPIPSGAPTGGACNSFPPWMALEWARDVGFSFLQAL